nr:hypothetical protein [Streptomyces sp. DSM 40484]
MSAAELPLLLRDHVIGSVSLLGSRPGALHPAALQLGQALADMAALGILRQRLFQDQAERIGQL